MSLQGGERSGDSSPRWQEQISQLAHLIWLRAIVLLVLGTSPSELKRGRAHLLKFIGAVVLFLSLGCIISVSFLGVKNLQLSMCRMSISS